MSPAGDSALAVVFRPACALRSAKNANRLSGFLPIAVHLVRVARARRLIAITRGAADQECIIEQGEDKMSTVVLETIKEAGSQHLAGKHLTFKLGRECYGVPVLQVREIIRLCDITPVPQMPDYIKGVLNLRGKIIPVADLRLRFKLSSIANTDLTCIVVVKISLPGNSVRHMGLIVDAVEEVVNLAAAEIEAPPNLGINTKADYVLGMAKVKGGVKILLDVDRLVAVPAAGAHHQALAA